MQYDFLEDDLLIICPSSYKQAILKYLTDTKKLINLKFMTILEYQKNYYFDYDIKAIHYLKDKNMKVENAINILDNLYYIEEKKYQNKKLKDLLKIKEELIQNNLLIFNSYFSKLCERKKKVVYGYGKLDSFYSKMLFDAQVIPYPKQNRKYSVYHFVNIYDEVEFVFQQICDLLQKGVDINNISLMNVNDEYFPIIKQVAKYYEIEVEYSSTDTLLGTMLGQKFYQLMESNDASEILAILKKYEDQEEYAFLVSLLNKYSEFKLNDVREEIKYELNNHKIKNIKTNNTIKIKNVFDFVDSYEYVFMLNFNNEAIPSFKMDTDYLTDNIKEEVGLMKLEEVNALIKENTLNYLTNINHLTISYKEKTAFNNYYPSILLDDMDYELLNYSRSFNYSHLANQNLYTKYLDDYIKYGIKNQSLDLLYSNYNDNDYLTYQNQFSGINQEKYINFLNNELTLSYSSVDNYFKCGFKYYLNNVLKVNLFEETFMTIIGNLFHHLLSLMNNSDFDLEKEYASYLANKTFTFKEKFFLEKLKKELVFIIETIHHHEFISGFTKMLYEEKIDIPLQKSPYVHFKGYIDKIMYQEKEGKTLVSIIDYKTGKTDINIHRLKWGLSMQLPIYLYLLKNSKLFNNITFTGMYLQEILNNVGKKDSEKSLEEVKKNNLKLKGYSTNNINQLAIFDSSYENSEMIRGMKVKKDGELSSSSNSLSDEEVANILKLTDEKIKEALDGIMQTSFYINPKIINGKNVSCEYCHFKDICYHNEQNNIYLKEEGDDSLANVDERTE